MYLTAESCYTPACKDTLFVPPLPSSKMRTFILILESTLIAPISRARAIPGPDANQIVIQSYEDETTALEIPKIAIIGPGKAGAALKDLNDELLCSGHAQGDAGGSKFSSRSEFIS